MVRFVKRQAKKQIASLIGENKGEKVYHYRPKYNGNKNQDMNEYYKILGQNGELISQIGMRIKNNRMAISNVKTDPKQRGRNLFSFLDKMAEQRAKDEQLDTAALSVWNYEKMSPQSVKDVEEQKKREKLYQKLGYREEPSINSRTKSFVKNIRWADLTNFPMIKPRKKDQ